MLPLELQLTRQTTSGKSSDRRGRFVQGAEGDEEVQMKTCLSWNEQYGEPSGSKEEIYIERKKRTWPQLARYVFASPRLGAQATSLTQSVCPSNFDSSVHVPSCPCFQILITLSQPPVASRKAAFGCSEVCGAVREPWVTDGAQDTLLTPTWWAGKMFSVHVPSAVSGPLIWLLCR